MDTKRLRTALHTFLPFLPSLAGLQAAIKARNRHRVLHSHLVDTGSSCLFAGFRAMWRAAVAFALLEFEENGGGDFSSLEVEEGGGKDYTLA